MSEVADRRASNDGRDSQREQKVDQSTPSNEAETTTTESDDQPTSRRRLGQYGLEAAIGIVLAVVILYVAWASSGEVPFVYEGY